MNETLYIELLGYLALVLGIGSFAVRKQHATRVLMAGGQGFMGAHLWLIGGTTAALMQFFLAVRTLISNYVKGKKATHVLFVLSVVISVSFTALSWQDWKSLLPLAAALNSTYAICYMDNQGMRKRLLISSFIWLVNGVLWQSIPQVLCEVLKLTFNAYTIWAMTKNHEFTTREPKAKEAMPSEMTAEETQLEVEVTKKMQSD